MILSIELTDKQLATIAEMVAKVIEASKPPESLTIDQAAKRLNVGRDSVARRVRAGIIPRIEGLNTVRIPSVHIDQLLGISNSDVPL